MHSIDYIATEFNIAPDELVEKSLRLYIKHELRRVETELFSLAKKYGVRTVAELDQKLKDGNLSEEDLIDDFFAFDHLENERDRLQRILV